MQTGFSSHAQLKIEDRLISSLSPYTGNARMHPKTQIKKLADSIKKFGWTNPIIIAPDGTVLCGHGRLEAAILLKMKTVPTICLEHMTEADRRAYIIADNAIAEQAGWSKQTLASELRGLAEIGYELELTGLDTLKIETLLSMDDPEEKVDDDVELPEDDYVPVSRVGDVWDIDVQRLAVGDARDPGIYDRLLQGERVQLVATDPPYGCKIENNVSGCPSSEHLALMAA